MNDKTFNDNLLRASASSGAWSCELWLNGKPVDANPTFATDGGNITVSWDTPVKFNRIRVALYGETECDTTEKYPWGLPVGVAFNFMQLVTNA